MLKVLSLITAAALYSASIAHAVPPVPTPVAVDNGFETVASRLTGKERLRRLMRQHFKYNNPITQSVRDATGDPNITVIDRRSGDPYQTYSCSYFFMRKKRVLLCE